MPFVRPRDNFCSTPSLTGQLANLAKSIRLASKVGVLSSPTVIHLTRDQACAHIGGLGITFVAKDPATADQLRVFELGHAALLGDLPDMGVEVGPYVSFLPYTHLYKFL